MKQFSELNSPRIAHGFFGRQGGYSTGIFASLNCGLGSGDERAVVLRNRGVVAQSLGGHEADIVTAHQVHSAEAMIVTHLFGHDHRPQLDGLVTNVPGIILGTLTADCGPVLFADAAAGVIGAAHAGWKGALTGITDATVAQMEALGAERSRVVAVLGPTISQRAYEVGTEFRARFLAADAATARYFTDSLKIGHYMFDLPRYLVERMRRFGIGTVIDSGLCTYSDEAGYFSYRRATHRHEADYGRQIAAITLRRAVA
jgi:YfiH family protein